VDAGLLVVERDRDGYVAGASSRPAPATRPSSSARGWNSHWPSPPPPSPA
jgi:hypothetical protein